MGLVMSIVSKWRRLLCRVFGHKLELRGTPCEETLAVQATGGDIISTKAFGAVTRIEWHASPRPAVVTFYGLLEPYRVCRRCGQEERR